jgi:hypothetical protein
MESWSIFIEIPPTLFPVNKGTFIAYSGTTGGSQAPHLHFEIRKTKEDINLNPMLFAMPIADKVAPVIQRLGIYDRTHSVYEGSPRLIPVKRTGNKFTISPSTIVVSSPLIGFGISAYDAQSGSTNHNGIFESDLIIDGKPIIGFGMNEISYDRTRGINAHIDYKLKAGGGPYVQELFQLQGYQNSIYKLIDGDGTIDLSNGKTRQVSIAVYDAYGNKALLQFAISYNGNKTVTATPPGKLFIPMMVDGCESPDCEFYLSENSLYDSVHIAYARISPDNVSVSALHTIGSSRVPLGAPVTVRIKPTRTLSEMERARAIMQRSAGEDREVRKVEWNNGWAKANFGEFGNFQLLIDDEAPQIVSSFQEGANLSKSSRIIINVQDNNLQYKNFRAELDGHWLRFTNDKGKSFIYNFDEKCSSGGHDLKVSIEDEAGNKTERIFHFTR